MAKERRIPKPEGIGFDVQVLPSVFDIRHSDWW
jgi:hypothetical protein